MYVQELIRKMPERITLVGNGSMENKADFINNSEYVIRFNGFQIEGYENHVGNKVDAIFYNNPDILNQVPEHYEKYRGKIPIFLHNYHKEGLPDDMIYMQPGTTTFFQAPLEIIDGVYRRFSAGAVLSLSLALVFQKKLDLVGFDFFKSSHYYEPDRILSPSHRGDDEEEMLRKISTITIHR